MSPKFIFLRHAEAEHNVAFREQLDNSVYQDEKYRDAPLTQVGLSQAQEAAKKLSEFSIIDIWCSPLTRCIQTAEEVFEESNASGLFLHDNLLERLGGGHICNSRKTKTELKNLHTLWNTKYLAETPVTWIERENEYAVRQRMFMLVMLIADIYKDAPDTSHILIVSHNDAISCLTGKSLKNAEHMIMTYSEVLNL